MTRVGLCREESTAACCSACVHSVLGGRGLSPLHCQVSIGRVLFIFLINLFEREKGSPNTLCRECGAPSRAWSRNPEIATQA